MTVCIGNRHISSVRIILIQSVYSQFHVVSSAATAMDYVLSHCLPLFRLCLPQVSVACKHVKKIQAQYLISFELDCQLFHNHPTCTLLTNALLGSAVNDNSMLKGRLVVPGMMMSSLPKLRNLTRNNWLWSISLGLCVTITFCMVPFMPLVILKERLGV